MAVSANGGLNIADEVKAGADSMIAKLSGMIWVGRGGSAFDTAKNNLMDDLVAISTAAGNLSDRLSHVSRNYGTTDDSANSNMARATPVAGGITATLRGLL